jgi:purine-binding chemotaxis protein CheW
MSGPDRGEADNAGAIAPTAVSLERRAAILAERAEVIARSRLEKREESLTVLALRVGGERYAIVAEEVSQVLEIKGLAPLIGAPEWLLGAMLARSRLVPVFDLRRLIGLERGGLSDLSRVAVLDEEGDMFGLAVESIDSQLTIPLSRLERPPQGPFRWSGPDGLAILDVAKLGSDLESERL